MQSAIAEKHTLELGTHQPCTQSLEKVNLDNSKSNNNQTTYMQRPKLDDTPKLNLKSSYNSKHRATEIMEKSSKIIFKARFKLFLIKLEASFKAFGPF